MQSRTVISFLASLALSASAALAQDAPPAPPAAQTMESAHDPMRGPMHANKEEFAEHPAQKCSDIAPRAIGKLAYLEAKLALTDKQKPLFDRWKRVKLESVKAHANECATKTPREMDASIIDRLKMHEKMLKSRLADLQAEMPSIAALVASLSDEQKHALERTHEMFGGHGMHGMHGMMERMHHGHGDDNDDNAPPPPPPAQ